MTAIVILLALLAVLIPMLSMQRRSLTGAAQPQSESLRKVMLGVIVALALLGVVLIVLLARGGA